jgi:dolichol-phosphate mannosyltransferase
MNKSIVKEGILGVLKLRWNSLFTSYKKKASNNGEVIHSIGSVEKNEMLIESK